ncbi:MAG: hypothetical protein QM831_11415 [Kofleriaceae bacterium]
MARFAVLALVLGCHHDSTPTTPVAKPPSKIALPGGNADGVGMDFLMWNPRTHTVWVPAGNSGLVDVIDTKTHALTSIQGFPTREVERNGHKRTVGPSAVALGPAGTVYIGSRGDSSICAVDEKALTKGTCVTLDSSPDGVVYVAPTNEVWVTTPRDKSIRMLDATTLQQKARVEFAGNPEGYAVDATRARFYTNLEDKDETLAITLDKHETVATWHPQCGSEGPHGVRLSEAEGHLVIGCSAEVHVLDVAHDGALLGKIAVGDGVDDIDLVGSTVYAAGGDAASLAILAIDPAGALTSVAQVPTGKGARNAVAADNGEIYVSDSKGAAIIVVTKP